MSIDCGQPGCSYNTKQNNQTHIEGMKTSSMAVYRSAVSPNVIGRLIRILKSPIPGTGEPSLEGRTLTAGVVTTGLIAASCVLPGAAIAAPILSAMTGISSTFLTEFLIELEEKYGSEIKSLEQKAGDPDSDFSLLLESFIIHTLKAENESLKKENKSLKEENEYLKGRAFTFINENRDLRYQIAKMEEKIQDLERCKKSSESQNFKDFIGMTNKLIIQAINQNNINQQQEFSDIRADLDQLKTQLSNSDNSQQPAIVLDNNFSPAPTTGNLDSSLAVIALADTFGFGLAFQEAFIDLSGVTECIDADVISDVSVNKISPQKDNVNFLPGDQTQEI